MMSSVACAGCTGMSLPNGPMEKIACTLAMMLDSLAEAGAQHALFGGLVAGFYGNARPTADIDMLVSRNCIVPLQTAVERRGYAVRHFPYLMRMYLHGEPQSVGDFVMLEANAVLRAAFATATPGEILGLPLNVVQRGVFVALKFEAAVTLKRRQQDRALDVADIRGVLRKEFGPQDERLAFAIAGRMRPGAVSDLGALLDDLRQGRWPRVVRRAELQTGLLLRRGLAPVAGRRGRWGHR